MQPAASLYQPEAAVDVCPFGLDEVGIRLTYWQSKSLTVTFKLNYNESFCLIYHELAVHKRERQKIHCYK